MDVGVVARYLELLSEVDRSNLYALAGLGPDRCKSLLEAANRTGLERNICFASVALLLSLLNKESRNAAVEEGQEESGARGATETS